MQNIVFFRIFVLAFSIVVITSEREKKEERNSRNTNNYKFYADKFLICDNFRSLYQHFHLRFRLLIYFVLRFLDFARLLFAISFGTTERHFYTIHDVLNQLEIQIGMIR